jgi:hypothetical protein
MSQVQAFREFVEYVGTLKGDEKCEAQVFCDKLFRAFGHAGYKEAGATLEERVKGKGQRTKFADLVWRPRLLIEMKSRGEKLERHYSQAFEYWLQLVPYRPKYVVLCNFDEFWVYDFDSQLDDPVDVVALADLPQRFTALNFLFPDERRPLFGNDRVAVTRSAADKVATVFNALVSRGEDREQAQRFVLQCVVARFSEDAELLPRGLFSELLNDCRSGTSSYDLIGGLFRQMNTPMPARAGRFKKVPYFNGGIFREISPIELEHMEIVKLIDAASEDWSKIQPPVFGTLFQSSMDQDERHALGAHFTSEADIQKVVLPTIVRPWRERIEAASTLAELRELRQALLNFQVLDPACGSGNFLYVAFRELKRIESELLEKIEKKFGRRAFRNDVATSLISTKQLFGIDKNAFAVELAKVTLTLAKELSLRDRSESIDFDLALPLDDLDENIVCDDALFCQWPKVAAIIGNPPFQSKNKMQQEFGPGYVSTARSRYPGVPGRADFCVYWFRRAHDELPEGGRAGLVGTNTIRQNYSREGGLDYIVEHGGTITEAVSSQVWSGEAVVHVSIVSWVKGEQVGKKKLIRQVGDQRDSPWEVAEYDRIGPALSNSLDVTQAIRLRASIESEACYQGQTHGQDGFLISPAEAAEFIRSESRNSDVLFPCLTADELFGTKPPAPLRFVIDFHPRDVLAASRYREPYQRVKQIVLPAREVAAKAEEKRNRAALAEGTRNRVNTHHRNFLKRWWLLSYPRPELIEKISSLPRFIVCGQVTKRTIFEFIHAKIRPNAALITFPLADDYSYGILQSGVHWAWFIVRCSTLKGDFRYTSDTVFDTFPWPQKPTLAQVAKVAETAVQLRALRRRVMTENHWSLRELYRTLDLPGDNPLKTAHGKLDAAVRAAYGMKAGDDPLGFLLDLNLKLADREAKNQTVVGPGLPPIVTDPSSFITEDCVRIP